jgi:hypothetical protein
LAGHTSGRVWERLEAFLRDSSAAILASTVSTLGLAIARVPGLLTLHFEELLDGLGIDTIGLSLREIRFPKSLAHGSLVSTSAAPKTLHFPRLPEP